MQAAIERVLEGRSGIEDQAGRDVFEGRFKQLKASGSDSDAIYRDLLARVFHAAGGGRLHVGDIKGKAGELGLKASGAEHYFGLVYIGDTSSFKALIEAECPDVEVEEDQIAEGLFDNIKKPASRINVLVGAKKFMQGWDSWRVTNMGLLNIGRSEGSEIIQLFGRGVRLLGLGRSLKRSEALSGDHPPGVELLERLNIFAIRAQLHDAVPRVPGARGHRAVGRRGIEIAHSPQRRVLEARTDRAATCPKRAALPSRNESCSNSIRPRRWSSTCRRRSSASAAPEEHSALRNSRAAPAPLAGGPGCLAGLGAAVPGACSISRRNAVFTISSSVAMTRGGCLPAHDPDLYALICDEALLRPANVDHVERLHSVMAAVLKKYVESFYHKRQLRWDSAKMVYAPLKKDDDNFQDYVVKVPRGDPELVKSIKEIIDEGNRIYRTFSPTCRDCTLNGTCTSPCSSAREAESSAQPAALERRRAAVRARLDRTLPDKTGPAGEKGVVPPPQLEPRKRNWIFRGQRVLPGLHSVGHRGRATATCLHRTAWNAP